jgi:cytochrome o ubiquinol oxidase subunit 1
VLFTMGGVAGVLLAVPPIDFQLHNTLFLVAHFHTMIVSGVLFGYFAAVTYWFPKYVGFRLNEKLGSYAFWGWLIGFILAFGPLYILGLMGATRRLNHYSASLGWQPLFIVAGIGASVIAVGLAFQLLQLAVSIRERAQTVDVDGDPWNGRSLEWSTPSPVPFYNFAITPEVDSRDPFWAFKQAKIDGAKVEEKEYEAITLPKNTPLGIYVGIFAFLFGFAAIWHIIWLVPIGLFGAIACIIIRSTDDDTEEHISAQKMKEMDMRARKQETYA